MPGPLTESRMSRFGRWAAAALLIAALHVSGAALALLRPPEDAPQAPPQGAILVDFAPVAAAPERQTSDAPPGPEAEESMAFATPVETAPVEAAKVEMPELDESPLAPDPDVVLPRRELTELDEEKELAETAASEAEIVPPSEASPETTAAPKIEGVVAREAAAPDLGMSEADKKAQLSWQGSLRSHLEGHKRYPGEARRRGEQGVVQLRFTIDRGGYVIDARIVKSSGSGALDAEALATIKRASPLPAPPRQFDDATYDFTIPIQFTVR
jgi:protein TonB